MLGGLAVAAVQDAEDGSLSPTAYVGTGQRGRHDSPRNAGVDTRQRRLRPDVAIRPARVRAAATIRRRRKSARRGRRHDAGTDRATVLRSRPGRARRGARHRPIPACPATTPGQGTDGTAGAAALRTDGAATRRRRDVTATRSRHLHGRPARRSERVARVLPASAEMPAGELTIDFRDERWRELLADAAIDRWSGPAVAAAVDLHVREHGRVPTLRSYDFRIFNGITAVGTGRRSRSSNRSCGVTRHPTRA